MYLVIAVRFMGVGFVDVATLCGHAWEHPDDPESDFHPAERIGVGVGIFSGIIFAEEITRGPPAVRS